MTNDQLIAKAIESLLITKDKGITDFIATFTPEEFKQLKDLTIFELLSLVKIGPLVRLAKALE